AVSARQLPTARSRIIEPVESRESPSVALLPSGSIVLLPAVESGAHYDQRRVYSCGRRLAARRGVRQAALQILQLRSDSTGGALPAHGYGGAGPAARHARRCAAVRSRDLACDRRVGLALHRAVRR